MKELEDNVPIVLLEDPTFGLLSSFLRLRWCWPGNEEFGPERPLRTTSISHDLDAIVFSSREHGSESRNDDCYRNSSVTSSTSNTHFQRIHSSPTQTSRRSFSASPQREQYQRTKQVHPYPTNNESEGLFIPSPLHSTMSPIMLKSIQRAQSVDTAADVNIPKDSSARKTLTSSSLVGTHSQRANNKVIMSDRPRRIQRTATAPGSSLTSQGTALPSTLPLQQTRPPLPRNSTVTTNTAGHSNPVVAARCRLPSEFSKASMNTTNSLHRRQAHESFQFSVSTIHLIMEPAKPELPPVFIDFDGVSPNLCELDRCATFSTFGDEDDPQNDESSLLLSTDEEAEADERQRESGYISPSEDELSPKTVISGPPPPESWMLNWAEQKNSQLSELSSLPEPVTKSAHNGPVYLPHNDALDSVESSSILVSGWAAISLSDSLRTKLATAERRPSLDRSEIQYFQLCRQSDKTHCLKIHGDDEYLQTIQLSPSCQVISQEVCSRSGKLVLVQDAWTRRVLCSILPVSLPPHFFTNDGSLVPQRHFSMLASTAFTPFYNGTYGSANTQDMEWGEDLCLRKYAPDEQHDAATHVLFALDAAIRQQRSSSGQR